jgi:hypothetical protein
MNRRCSHIYDVDVFNHDHLCGRRPRRKQKQEENPTSFTATGRRTPMCHLGILKRLAPLWHSIFPNEEQAIVLACSRLDVQTPRESNIRHGSAIFRLGTALSPSQGCCDDPEQPADADLPQKYQQRGRTTRRDDRSPRQPFLPLSIQPSAERYSRAGLDVLYIYHSFTLPEEWSPVLCLRTAGPH